MLCRPEPPPRSSTLTNRGASGLEVSSAAHACYMSAVPKRNYVHKVLIIRSGPIVIGQACEFDYSGAPPCLRSIAIVEYPTASIHNSKGEGDEQNEAGTHVVFHRPAGAFSVCPLGACRFRPRRGPHFLSCAIRTPRPGRARFLQQRRRPRNPHRPLLPGQR